ncbi:MAG: hypothetical protein IPL77_20035 [Flavobacteriales bacterium]|jgi:hypothetical protein|nr:hypothetical protein [Flavobacteriales bacterium]MBK9538637.1 hypothetical protein [Flavobacteriales bacterium]
MKPFDLKRAWPYLAIVALFYTLSLAYFSPVLEGKQMVQGDKRNWQGMAQEMMEHQEEFGVYPRWTGSMFGGMPSYQIIGDTEDNLLHVVDDLFHGFLPRPASFLFLYLAGMFILLSCLGVGPWLSLVGALAYAFSSYFFAVLEAGHNSKANAIGYMPMVLAGVYLVYRGRKWLGAALLALFMGLQIMMNHVQVTYYLGMVIVLFVLAEAVRSVQERTLPDFLTRSGLAAMAVVLALLCNTGLLWSTWEYGKYTTRGASELTIKPDGSPASDIRTGGLDRDYVTQWSYGKQESFTLLIPDAKGGPTGAIGNDPDALAKVDPRFRENLGRMNRYWGDQSFTSGPVYVGALALLLMLLLIMTAEARARWWALGALVLIGALLAVDAPLLAGALVIAYLLAGLYCWRDPLPYALFSGLVLTLLLSWGHNYMPLTDFFLDHVPGYNKFRAVTIILVIVELAVPVLGVLFLQRLLRDGAWEKALERRALITCGVLALALVAMASAPASFFDLLSDMERSSFNEQLEANPKSEAQLVAVVEALKEVRAGIFSADAWRSFAFVVAGGALVFFYGRRKMPLAAFLGGVGALILIDLWTVDKRMVNNDKDRGRYLQWEDPSAAAYPFAPTKADMAILQQEETEASRAEYAKRSDARKALRAREKGSARKVTELEEVVMRFGSVRRHSHYRVLSLNNPFNDSRVSYFHKSLGGYHGAKLKRYQELIEFHIAPEYSEVLSLLQAGTDPASLAAVLARQPVLNMLNARYLIGSPDQAPIRNPNALGPAWFVRDVQWAKDADAEIQAVGGIDPRISAVVDERFHSTLKGDGNTDTLAQVTLTEYRTDRLTYTTRSTSGGVVVFSEIWYGPDWHASIDGAPAEHVRADYVLRAMDLPPGEHTVVFQLESKSTSTGGKVTLASSALLLLLVLGALFGEWRRARSA